MSNACKLMYLGQNAAHCQTPGSHRSVRVCQGSAQQLAGKTRKTQCWKLLGKEEVKLNHWKVV